MGVDERTLKERFPHLAREIESEYSKIRIVSFRVSGDEADKGTDTFRSYIPTAIDYLRRCDTQEQARETILYLQEKREITKALAEALLTQLDERGLKSFGPKKEP